MEPAVTRYLDREGPAFAYQMYGGGNIDVVFAGDVNHHVDLAWSDPHIHQMMEKLAQSVRVTIFQPRGFGPSEPTGKPVTVEEQADDIIAVMDAVGIRRACVYGNMTTSWGAALAAARQPGRVSALVLGNPVAQGPRSAPPEGMTGWTADEIETCIRKAQEVADRWGEGMAITLWDGELATPYNRRLGGLLERCSATPAMAQSYINYYLRYDAREILRAVRVPTWVLRTPGNIFPEAAARHVAELLPNATFHELEPTPTGASLGEALTPLFNFLAQVAVGELVPADLDRFLATVLFTDICSSTELLADMGDSRYTELRAAHERQVRFEVTSNTGQLVNVIGDGTFSIFDGPAKAVRSAQRICESAEAIGIKVRAGLHTGEVERSGGDYAGMTVHIGARVAAAAGPSEVLVSRTTRDLVMFSGLTFTSRGEQPLKGVPGSWELFAHDIGGEEPVAVPIEGSIETPIDRLALQVSKRAPGLGRAALKVGNHWQRRSLAKSR